MPINILIVTEGATERVVGKTLYRRRLLNQNGRPHPPNWESVFKQGSKSKKQKDKKTKNQIREGYDQIIKLFAQLSLSSEQRVLLIFDQEDSPTPQSRAELIAQDLARYNPFWSTLSWSPLGTHRNLFKAQIGGACIVLHVSNSAAPNITNRDFDGYILELLQGPEKLKIASLIVSTNLAFRLLEKAEREFTNLMGANGFPWKRNKAWLYAYITAFQARESHVWFAEEVVQHAPEAELQRVFAPLIYAWNWLVQNGGTCL